MRITIGGTVCVCCHLESPPDVVVPHSLVDGPDEVCWCELALLHHWEALTQ